MGLEEFAKIIIGAAAIQWPITAYTAFQAYRNKETALTFTLGVFVMCSFIMSLGAFLSIVYLQGIGLPPGTGAVILVAIFLTVSIIQPVWFVGVYFGRFK